MGHEVRLMSGRFVKAFNVRNRSDAADAQAIWLAARQPGKAVAVKTETRQAMLSRHHSACQKIAQAKYSSSHNK
jgi:tRNA A37 threonylcarbamoyladenosine synthetase subunit TsaC/SUA5/YrdC